MSLLCSGSINRHKILYEATRRPNAAVGLLFENTRRMIEAIRCAAILKLVLVWIACPLEAQLPAFDPLGRPDWSGAGVLFDSWNGMNAKAIETVWPVAGHMRMRLSANQVTSWTKVAGGLGALLPLGLNESVGLHLGAQREVWKQSGTDAWSAWSQLAFTAKKNQSTVHAWFNLVFRPQLNPFQIQAGLKFGGIWNYKADRIYCSVRCRWSQQGLQWEGVFRAEIHRLLQSGLTVQTHPFGFGLSVAWVMPNSEMALSLGPAPWIGWKSRFEWIKNNS